MKEDSARCDNCDVKLTRETGFNFYDSVPYKTEKVNKGRVALVCNDCDFILSRTEILREL